MPLLYQIRPLSHRAACLCFDTLLISSIIFYTVSEQFESSDETPGDDRLDPHQLYELAQERAILDRQKTLNKAFMAAYRLLMSNVQPDPECEIVCDEPLFKERGIFTKRQVQIGSRQYTILRGWHLPFEQPSIHGYINQLTLLPYENTDRSLIVWHPQRTNLTKADIHPLPQVPLTGLDMPWTKIDRKDSTAGPEQPLFIERESARNGVRADYESYRKAKVEKRIREAIDSLLTHKGIPQ